MSDAVAFGPGVDEVVEPKPKVKKSQPRAQRPTPPEDEPKREATPGLPKAIVITSDCATDFLGSMQTYRENQHITDPHLIRIVVDAGLPYREA